MTNARVLALTRYARLGASSRLRFYQYQNLLAAAGVDLVVRPLFDDAYVQALQAGQRSATAMLTAFLRRLGQCRDIGDFDVVWLEKELYPYLPYFLEQRLIKNAAKLVIDFDDAVFHNYDLSRNYLVQGLLADKIDRLMARADGVIAGNSYLADRAEKAGAAAIELIPTAIDAEKYRVADQTLNAERLPRIGWIGQSSTSHYLEQLQPVLSRLQERYNFEFVVIGAVSVPLKLQNIDYIPWSEDGEIAAIDSLDIGVMPLIDGPWERGKCGYKLIQYMGCAKPVVGSAVGANLDIVQNGVNGYLAENQEDWYQALSSLMDNGGQASAMGKQGRSSVERHYNTQTCGRQLAGFIQRLAGSGD